jgi:hypothetical protein
MIHCGAGWQPTDVERVIEVYPTSTRVAKVVTDVGIAFLKGMGNPAGNESLSCELVGSELAAEIGLSVPPFAILDLQGIEITRSDGHVVQFGPAFVSKELTGMTSDAGDVFLSRLINPTHVPRLVVFDTWVRNFDRCPPIGYFDPTPRRDNLLFSPNGRKFELVALDHTHCFIETDLETDLAGSHFVDDDGLYGLFPEFGPFVTEPAVRDAIEALRAVGDVAIEEIIESVPHEWGPDAGTRQRWRDALRERRDRVADHIMEKLVNQGQLGL